MTGNPLRLLAVALPEERLAEVRRQLDEVAEEAALESFQDLEEIDVRVLQGDGVLLLLSLETPAGNALEDLRSLRQRGILTPALVLIPAAAMDQGLEQGDLGGVDLLPLEGLTALDLRRGLFHLAAIHRLQLRILELENRLQESEETRLQQKRRLDELSHHLAMSEVDDELTGLRTEGYMVRRIEESIEMARRYGTPVVCLLVGIDHLEILKERYGASFTDYVLVQLAHRLKRSIRSTDLLSRYGKEGFLVVSPFTSESGARTLAERLKRAAVEEPIDPKRPSLRPTVSIGIAVLGTDILGPEDLIQRAASALARAREAGGQQIETA